MLWHCCETLWPLRHEACHARRLQAPRQRELCQTSNRRSRQVHRPPVMAQPVATERYSRQPPSRIPTHPEISDAEHTLILALPHRCHHTRTFRDQLLRCRRPERGAGGDQRIPRRVGRRGPRALRRRVDAGDARPHARQALRTPTPATVGPCQRSVRMRFLPERLQFEEGSRAKPSTISSLDTSRVGLVFVMQ